MDTMNAYAYAMAAASRGAASRVFDWDEAARRIRERQPGVARAGLGLDWEWTGGTIYADGKPDLEAYTYLASNWAIPELDLDGEIEPCWRWQDGSGWDADTKWPASALAVLNGDPAKETQP